MSEHIHEQISAFLDDELSSEESAFLVRRLTSDTLAHQQTVRYAAFGSALREENLLANSSILRDRIHAVLDGVPMSQSAARAPSKRRWRWVRLAAGAGIAAGVAVVALFGLRTMTDVDSLSGSAAIGHPDEWTEPDSYVVPGESMPAEPAVNVPIRLTNYMMQHGAFASSINRTSVQSHVISEHESEPAEQATDEVQVQ